MSGESKTAAVTLQSPTYETYTNKEFVKQFPLPEGPFERNVDDLIKQTYQWIIPVIKDAPGYFPSDDGHLPWVEGILTLASVEGKVVGRTCIFWDSQNHAEFGGTNIISDYHGRKVCKPLVMAILNEFKKYVQFEKVVMGVSSAMMSAIFCYVKAALESGYRVYMYNKRTKEQGKEITSTEHGCLIQIDKQRLTIKKQAFYVMAFLFVKGDTDSLQGSTNAPSDGGAKTQLVLRF
jgi:hypothetical protein